MSTTGTQTQPKNALQLALERALLQQAQAAKKAPAPVARKPIAPKQPAKPAAPRTIAGLAIQLAAEDRAGRLNLKLPAAELAKGFGVDVRFLSAAMTAAGFVRVLRGVTGELFYGRKQK